MAELRETYVNGGNGVAGVLGVLEESKDIIANDDTGLAGEDLVSVVVSRYSAGIVLLGSTYRLCGNHYVCDV